MAINPSERLARLTLIGLLITCGCDAPKPPDQATLLISCQNHAKQVQLSLLFHLEGERRGLPHNLDLPGHLMFASWCAPLPGRLNCNHAAPEARIGGWQALNLFPDQWTELAQRWTTLVGDGNPPFAWCGQSNTLQRRVVLTANRVEPATSDADWHVAIEVVSESELRNRITRLNGILAALGFEPILVDAPPLLPWLRERPVNVLLLPPELRPMSTRAEIEKISARLKRDPANLEALEQLLMSGPVLGHVGAAGLTTSGDPALDAAVHQAVRALEPCRNFMTIRAALESSSGVLQSWSLRAMNFIGQDLPDDDWAELLPQVRRFATNAPPELRGDAQAALQTFDYQQDFLADCAEIETSAWNLMRLLHVPDKVEFEQRLMPNLLRLLDHRDAEVRRHVMLDIGSNSDSAPMWQIRFDQAVFERVFELSRSPDARQRSAAVFALTNLRRRNPEAILARMSEMVNDPSEDVRWRIPAALRDQQDHPEAQRLLRLLLGDPSAAVQYFTLLELGPERHVQQLEMIAKGRDRKAAEFAAQKLKQLLEVGRPVEP